MSIILAGLMLGASLIVAIGPQNLMVITYGIRRQSVTAVILVCFLSDIVLYIAGTLGVAVIVSAVPWLLDALRWLGVVFLIVLAGQSAWEAARPKQAVLAATDQAGQTVRQGWVGPVRTILAVTWLNPAAFLDTLVIGGTLSNHYGEDGRWLFVLGAIIASAIWFPLLGYGAAALSEPLSRPTVWRVLKAVVAVMLLVIAVRLALM